MKEYIDSGILELYVYGVLTHQENVEVYKALQQYPEVAQEVEEIEKALQQLSMAAAPYSPEKMLTKIKSKLEFTGDDEKVIPLSRKRTPIIAYIGYAAAALLLVGLLFQSREVSKLETQISDLEREQILQEGKTQVAEENLAATKEVLNAIRHKDVIKVPLAGQAVAPQAYASVFWDKASNKAYIDVSGLPEPPAGKVYQVWSLTLEPLTPTSMGVLDTYNAEGLQIIELDNPNASEAFGITLEPAGGSAGPTMDQLYTLGVVSS
ncbi:anti-sigma factor [Dokdonia sinensis]|uniref:Anti-sigma factor n=1 Tax=Dokdonia sinensis TaxID=2479847 RepID=A0A3M0GCX8_9FLAO|nr:anti-sigma factor [Dokdonia sinensis]RMB62725.1 anti-sigma factor [Dokdonia sinensis]